MDTDAGHKRFFSFCHALIVESLGDFLYLKRRGKCQIGMILLFIGGIPECHQCIADKLVHGSSPGRHRLDQHLKVIIQQLCQRFWIHSIGDRGVARNISEQNRDLSLLSCYSSPLRLQLNQLADKIFRDITEENLKARQHRPKRLLG